MKKAIVLGASSGIGMELARLLAGDGCMVGLAARRVDALDELARELGGGARVKRIDLAGPEEAARLLRGFIDELGGADLIVISSGVDRFTPALEWEPTREIIDVNVAGFTAVANEAYRYFESRGEGHLVGISSIAALRGNEGHPAYSASKAFVSNYMEGLRIKAMNAGLAITVTDIRPGNVDTPMSRGQEGLFWVAPPRKAAAQILEAIRKKKNIAYVTRRWRAVAHLMRILPVGIWRKL